MLNQTSAWWMHSTQHIAPNALLAVPDPNVSIMRRCRVFPVEFVVRGYLTGNAVQVRSSCNTTPCCSTPFSGASKPQLHVHDVVHIVLCARLGNQEAFR